MTAEGAAKGAAETAKESAIEIADVLLVYVIPIILFAFGFILAEMLGLSGFYAAFLSQVPALGGSITNALADGAAVVTYGVLGLGLVAVGHRRDHWIGDLVGAFGWMFVGAALDEAANFVLNKGTPITGALDGAGLLSTLEGTVP